MTDRYLPKLRAYMALADEQHALALQVIDLMRQAARREKEGEKLLAQLERLQDSDGSDLANESIHEAVHESEVEVLSAEHILELAGEGKRPPKRPQDPYRPVFRYMRG